MSNPIDVKPANQVATLVSFEYGLPSAPTVNRYAIWTSNVTYDGQVFTAVPGMEVDYGNQAGGLADAPAEITSALVDPISSLRGNFPPVAVVIRELKPGSDATAKIMWGGKITLVTFNNNGNSNTAKLVIAGHKQALQADLSFTLGEFCPNIFGANACAFDLASARETGTVVAISGQKITVSGLTSISRADWFRFGDMTVDGFPLQINSHTLGTGEFYLVRPPPAYWIGRTVAVLPGCDKTIPACVIRGQTENYTQIGIKIPNRDVRVFA